MSATLGRSIPFLLAALLSLAGRAAGQTPPVADAGTDQQIDCAPPAGADVALDGTGSFDPDGGPLTHRWTDATLAELSTDAMPIVQLSPGVHVLTLTVDDGVDPPASDDVTITVNADATPPEIVLAVDGDELWPPNHRSHSYAVADLVESVSDDCSDLARDDVVFDRGTSDEPDNGRGDGNTRDDVSFREGCSQAEVRAERAGPGDGRVYELFLRVEDEAGNVADEPFTISVPHDRAHDPGDSGDVAEYECQGEARPSCAPAPDPACSGAGASEITIRDGSKGARLRWRARGFTAGSLSDEGNALCLYTDGAASGGSQSPDRVRVKSKRGQASLAVFTKGSDLEIPVLPLAASAALRLELHDATGGCVSSTFEDPSINQADRYEAEVE
jgi:hypothetical protein